VTRLDGWPKPVDLLLGSALGAWVLDGVREHEVGTVWTDDQDVAWKARGLGIPVRTGAIRDVVSALAVSVHFPRILAPGELGCYERAYNLHPGLLPWGRGFYPYLWTIVAGEPAGATLHRMSERVDAGPIVAQEPVESRPDDTARVMIARIRAAERSLFATWWPRIVEGEVLAEEQQPTGGSYHAKADAERWRGLDEERARRAFSF
jgi:methionyl-tRNA formyltransferase